MIDSFFVKTIMNPLRHFLQKVFYMVLDEKMQLFEFLRYCCQKGLLGQSALRMMEGVLHISEMRARDIMIPRAQMVVISKEATIEEVHQIVISSGHSRFPVTNEKQDTAEGILLAKDVLRHHANEQVEGFNIKDHLRPAVFVPESKRLNILLNEFRRTRNHMAIVVDEYGAICGLMTIEDVLEQIVGDITDEHDAAEDDFVQEETGGRYVVKALMPIAEFNEHFLAKMDVQVADTIGGFLIQAFGYLPKRGEQKNIGQFLFEVNRADNRRIYSLLVTRKSDK